MENQLAYPVLGYFRSQHLNQNWLASLTAVVDASAFFVATVPENEEDNAILTLAIGRHALADLAHVFRARLPDDGHERLTVEQFSELHRRISEAGIELVERDEAWAHLQKIRRAYEPYARGLSSWLALRLPDWMPEGEVERNWRLSEWRTRRVSRLP
jgi:hypothetical protein